MTKQETNSSNSLWAKAARAVSVVRLTPFDASTREGRSRERYRKIVLTSTSGLLARGIGMLASLATVPLALSYLGKAQFGLWATITSLLAWVTVFNFGIVNGLLNMVSQAHGRDDRTVAASYVSTAFFMLCALSAVLGIAFAVMAPFVPWEWLLAVRGLVAPEVVMWSVVTAVIVVLVGMPLSIVPQVYAGYQKMYIANVFLLAGSLLTLAAMLLAIYLEVSLPILVMVFGGATPVVYLLGLVYASGYEMPWVRPRPSLVSLQALRRLTTLSVPLFLFQVAALLVNQTDLIILAHRTDLGTVADYSIILRLYLLLAGFITLSTYSFIPTFRESYERGDLGWMRSSFRRLLYLRMSLAVLAGLVMVVAGNWLLRLWLRGDAIAFSTEVWAALAILLLTATWATAFSDLLIVLDRIWGQVVLVFINGVTTVLLIYWLTPSLGVLGAIVSMGFLTTVAWTWLLPLMARPVLRLGQP